MKAATGRPYGNARILEIESGGTRSPSVEDSLGRSYGTVARETT
jgi:hypothetical protein